MTGIEFGSGAIKIATIAPRGSGWALRRAVRIPLPEDAREGWTPETVTAVLPAVRDAGTGLRRSVIGVSGKDVMLRTIHLPPADAEKMRLMMHYEMAEISSRSGEPVTCDYRLLNLPRGLSSENSILVGYAREAAIGGLLDALAPAGVRASLVTPTCVSIFNALAVLGTWDDAEPVLLLDIGAERLEIALGADRTFYFARMVGPGGRTFTEAVATHLKVDAGTAESMKRKIGELPGSWSGGGSRQKTEISTALEEAAGEMLSVVRSSVLFSRAQTKIKDLAPVRVFVTGGGAALRGFQPWLEEKFGKPVTLFHPASGMDLSALPSAERAWVDSAPGEVTAAIGLALAGFRADAVALDLLPNSIKERRRFRQGTLFLWLAGAAVVLLAGILLADAIRGYREATRAAEERRAVEASVESRQKQYAEAKGRAQETAGKISTLIAEGAGNRLALELLHALQTETPPPVTLSGVAVEKRRVEAPGKRDELNVRVGGVVHPSEKDVFEILSAYRDRLIVACPSFQLKGGTEKAVKDAAGNLSFEFRMLTTVEGAKP